MDREAAFERVKGDVARDAKVYLLLLLSAPPYSLVSPRAALGSVHQHTQHMSG